MWKIRFVSNRFFVSGALVIILLSQSGYALARTWHRRPGREIHRRHHHYRRIPVLPRNRISISLGGLRFYYGDGVFYRRARRGYVVVRPPIGAVVARLPFGHLTLIIEGDKYYYYDGAYYRACPSGYVVIPPPVVYAPEAMVIKPAADGADSAETVVIYIPDPAGGYTPVVLHKSGGGYIGPQGEYYPDNPTIEQLKTLYGR